jgi:hypothetical protein
MIQKLRENIVFRYLVIFVCFIFILGAALNDGWSGWFWGLPFIFVMHMVLPVHSKQKSTIVFIALIFMIGVSYGKSNSPFVYPAIGDQIEVKEIIPTIVLESYLGTRPNYDYVGMKEEMESGRCQSCGEAGVISVGTVLVLERIIPTHADFGLGHEFIFSDTNGKLLQVSDNALWRVNEDGLGSFCSRVNWDNCAEDPMHPFLRLLASLMYYPALPLIAISWF